MKGRIKWVFTFLLILTIASIGFSLTYWRVQEVVLQYYYDLQNPQKEILTQKEINRVLASFEAVSYEKMDKSYLQYTLSDVAKYKKLLQGKQYYRISRNDFFKYIVGDVRIKDLLAKDKYYKACLWNREANYYWLINKNVLYKFLQLQDELERLGYDRKAYKVRNGHRHPKYNKTIGGASLSRHILGEAIDLGIRDIDRNGKYEEKDKQIVLDLLDKTIIGSKGGVGKYPNTKAVHFDVRGYRARWDSY
ncbi:MAG: D-Ala-D-Ala carboxypeptidase family metallohydrolase [Chitinophagales bacterium]